jgi:signal transduction histidine kinase/CHASE1-domain containing sensor protein
MRVVPLGPTRLSSVVPALILAAAYAIAGWLGLWLAIAPGYAAGLWPASGLALAGMLIGGTRAWPGIWLGSFVVNLWTVLDTFPGAALLTSVAIPTGIGVGAAMQALVGATLVRRHVGFPSALTRAYEIGTFLVLGGPVSCLVSATVGVTTLTVSGQIPWEMFVITWWTWWVGDTLGVVIATPLVLSWLAEPRAVWRRRRISVALPLLGVSALAFIVFGYTRGQEEERLRLLFVRQAESMAHTIRTRLVEHLDVLYTFESFYSSTEVSRQAFHIFAQQSLAHEPHLVWWGILREAFHIFAQRSLARHPDLQALSLDLRVPDARREAYEQAMRREGFPDFQISEQTAQGELVRAARRPEYVVVTYIEPYEGNERALGLDVVSLPGRLEALQRARDTGQLVATGRVTLVQDPGRKFGLLVFQPVYGRGLAFRTVEERRLSLQGYVTGVFWISDMVEASLRGLDRHGIVLQVKDETAPAGQRLLYDSRAPALEGLDPALDEELGKPSTGMHWKTTVELAGGRWELGFTPTLEYLAARQSLQPWTVLGGGLAFTSLLGCFLLVVTGRATIIEQLMVERTAQLEASQRMEAEAEQRRREAEVLAELARTINAILDMDAILQRVADGAKELCDGDGATIALCEPGDTAAVIRYWAGTRSRGYYGVRIEPGQGIGGLVLATGRPCRTDDYARDSRLSHEYLPLIRTGRTVGVLVVPIRSGERVDGLLYVGSEQPRTFTDHDEAILQRLADHAAIALHNARLYAAAEQRRRIAESLSEVGRLLSQSLDSIEVGQRIVHHVRRLLQAQVAVLYQLAPGSGRLVALAVTDDIESATGLWRTLPPEMGMAGLAVRTRQPVLTANLLTDPRIMFPAAIRDHFEPNSPCAVLSLPLLCDGQVIGALSIWDAAGRTFDDDALALARPFADQAATALANAQLYAEVQAARERLQELSRQLLDAQEAERRRIAHELHDEAGQLLASVHLALEEAVSVLPPSFRQCFQQVRGQLDAIEAQLRRLSHELRPTILDDLGLLPALRFFVQGVAARTGLRIRLDSTIEGRLAPPIETALYRIMQEGLTNIIKHAAATQVHLQLRRDKRMVHGLIHDNGAGFAVDQVMHRKGSQGLGLLGIRERLEALGGTLQITSAPGQGTTLQITLPVDPGEVSSGANCTWADPSLLASAGLHETE